MGRKRTTGSRSVWPDGSRPEAGTADRGNAPGGKEDRRENRETMACKVSSSLKKNEAWLNEQCAGCADILMHRMKLGQEMDVDALLVHIEVTVSNTLLEDSLMGRLLNRLREIPTDTRKFSRSQPKDTLRWGCRRLKQKRHCADPGRDLRNL